MAENDKNEPPFFLNKNELQLWTGHWHANRRIMLSGELNADSIKRASLELTKLGYMNTEPITLMIESGGGNVLPAQQLEDVINMQNCPVDALIIGNCASMAVDLVQMCRKRMILPSSRMLVHYVRYGQGWIFDDPERVESDLIYFRERMKEIAEKRLALYEKRTNLSREKLAEIFRHGEVHQAYFSAKQALELNLVDEIVTNFKIFPRKAEETK